MTEHSFDISECSGDQDVARWLLRCSFENLCRDEAYIRRWLRMSGFRDGLAYLEDVLSILREDRRDDGHMSNFMTFSRINGRMRRIAEGLAPVGLGD